MQNKNIKFSAFLCLALVGVAVSSSNYVANSMKTGAVTISNQEVGLKETANDDYVVLWDNPNFNPKTSIIFAN